MRRLPLFWLAAACHRDFCDAEAAIAEDCGAEVDAEDRAQCDEAIAHCTGHDRKLLDDYLDCMDDAGLLGCEDATVTTTDDGQLGALFACAAPLFELSTGCSDFQGKR